MMQGTLYIISAPSGTGKSSLIQALLENLHNTQVSISYTTRARRPGEKHGQHYFFVSINEFEKMIAEDAFLEYARVFDNYYGTSREKIKKLITMGIDVVLDIDWQGAKTIRRKMYNVKSIFILPPSRSELDKRLRSRGQDSASVIARRIERAVSEITHYIWYDYLIINDNFNTALLDLKAIILAERLHLNQQRLRHNILIRNLLKD